MAPSSVSLRADDGVELEGELARPEGRAYGEMADIAVVLCHPHPQFGGSMRSLVTSVLFTELAAAGYPCLRFNFRGVERSTGEYSDGKYEPLDVVAGISAMADALPATPIAVVGWSFGADMALSVVDARLAGWVAIAPPLRFGGSFAAAADARPKHLILGENDDFRAPAEVQTEVARWTATSVAIVPGASHFFVGRTDAVVTETRAALDRLTISYPHRLTGERVTPFPLSQDRRRGETVRFEEGLSAAYRGTPRFEIAVEGRAVAVFVRVLELVEGAIFGVEERSVSAEEMIVNRNTVRKSVHLGHQTPSLCDEPCPPLDFGHGTRATARAEPPIGYSRVTKCGGGSDPNTLLGSGITGGR